MMIDILVVLGGALAHRLDQWQLFCFDPRRLPWQRLRAMASVAEKEQNRRNHADTRLVLCVRQRANLRVILVVGQCAVHEEEGEDRKGLRRRRYLVEGGRTAGGLQHVFLILRNAASFRSSASPLCFSLACSVLLRNDVLGYRIGRSITARSLRVDRSNPAEST